MTLATPILAAPCACTRPQLLGDDPTCLACGRDLVVSAECDGTDGWTRLWIDVELGCRDLRRRARAAGIDPDTQHAAYRDWLIRHMPTGG